MSSILCKCTVQCITLQSLHKQVKLSQSFSFWHLREGEGSVGLLRGSADVFRRWQTNLNLLTICHILFYIYPPLFRFSFCKARVQDILNLNSIGCRVWSFLYINMRTWLIGRAVTAVQNKTRNWENTTNQYEINCKI